MVHTIIWAIYFILYLIVVSPVMLYCRHQIKKGNREKVMPLVKHMAYHWADRLLWAAGAKIEVIGQENIPEGTAVFVANHQSDFDIPVVLTQTGDPRALLAKVSLSKIPGLRGWMDLLQCVYVDRSDEKQSLRALMDSTKLVKSGVSMTIFPEGTRSKGGPVKEFKGGAFRIATSAKVPVVPISIEGTYHLLEERNRIHSGTVRVTIHEPIPTAGMSRQEVRELPGRVRQQILSVMDDKYKGQEDN
ncbi:MAG: lysophospholipid acyltransferase family protein [Eubacteriales bacterium]|nr:lysophospholipid acyltransferase family protein [Eubacteriales bacterium]